MNVPAPRQTSAILTLHVTTLKDPTRAAVLTGIRVMEKIAQVNTELGVSLALSFYQSSKSLSL